MRRALAAALAVAALAVPVIPGRAESAPTAAPAPIPSKIRAGVGVADATWHVGAGAGQYTEKEPPNPGGDFDPHQHSLSQRDSKGVQSRLTIRAIVVEGNNGERAALVKSDNYLAQNLLLRRVGQLLEGGTSGITPDRILHAATHNHSSPYYSTPSWGVWVFQDVMDLRMLEYQARAMASAIEKAAADLRPARMGATTIDFSTYKANIARPQTADDGTPAGYPEDCSSPQPEWAKPCDNGLVVLRFDDVSRSTPKPLATWMNFGQHPESLDDFDLITADFLAPLERFVDRETGVPLVFSQGDVGSSEGPYEGWQTSRQTLPDGTARAWGHVGYAQTERGARLMADAVMQGWREIGAGAGDVPYSSDFPVGAMTKWFAGPYSHPYPSVSNCRSESSVEGDPGSPILGLPDCERDPEDLPGNTFEDFSGEEVPDLPPDGAPFDPLWENLKEHGIPVPDHYDAPGFTGVEENLRLHLQAFRLGDVVLASCACEAQVDIILNFESRANDVGGDIYDGYPWDRFCTANGDDTWTCPDQQRPGQTVTIDDARYQRMKAQIHNDAKGWDDPANAIAANSEPADPSKIWGNFTKEELTPEHGYKLAVGVGHAGDYNGYTVSYREYMAYDHYRKALTSYGPHTADYMATRMVRLAGALKGDTEAAALVNAEANDPRALADEGRQEAEAQALGRAAGGAYDAWQAALPDDVGPAAALEQPADVPRFSEAVFAWQGGSNAVDNPVVRVERRVDNRWVPYAAQKGEVVTLLDMPSGVEGVADTYTGQQSWVWRAAFETFDGQPARFGQTPSGRYRFVVDGNIRQGRQTVPYQLASSDFRITPWTGIQVSGFQVGSDGRASFAVAPIEYPKSHPSVTGFTAVEGAWERGEEPVCDTCSFRPWAERGEVKTATVTVRRKAGGMQLVPASFDGDRWVTGPLGLQAGDRAYVARGGVVDRWGEINGAATPQFVAGAATTGSAAVTSDATAAAGLGAVDAALDLTGPSEPTTLEATPVSSSRGFPATGALVAALVAIVAAAALARRGRRWRA